MINTSLNINTIKNILEVNNVRTLIINKEQIIFNFNIINNSPIREMRLMLRNYVNNVNLLTKEILSISIFDVDMSKFKLKINNSKIASYLSLFNSKDEFYGDVICFDGLINTDLILKYIKEKDFILNSLYNTDKFNEELITEYDKC